MSDIVCEAVLTLEAATVTVGVSDASPSGKGASAVTRPVRCPWRALAGVAWLDGVCRACKTHRVVRGDRRVLSVSAVTEASPCPDCVDWCDR